MDELRDLVEDAGFQEASFRLGVGGVRYASVEEFLRQEAASSPLAGPIGALSEDVREAMIDELGLSLRAYADDYGITFPTETYIVSARR